MATAAQNPPRASQSEIARWLDLTRNRMPDAAMARDWPVRFDHCFQRILLDNAVGGPWRDTITPPAYRNIDSITLARAIGLGEDALEGRADLAAMNRRSLAWRGRG
ncbi:MAG: GCN5-related N-acetyltransferase [Erythrobacter sp.]|jgi:hypothetical protein|nr:GCN5-related N-acetyltransferase [Erythrobacter sp.]